MTGAGALLFALNASITPLLFRTSYTAQMGSIEGAYIGLGRYVAQHWDDMGWFPLWYGGVPYADTYPPLLHWIVGLVLSLSGASPGLAYHLVTALFYCLGPVTLFWMAWRLSGSRACALAAGIGYSLISPTCLLVTAARHDVDGILGPRRLLTLVSWGEGPHVASLCLLPLAIGTLHVALEKRKPWWWVAAAISIATVPLTNWLGGMALAIAVAAYLFAGLPKGRTSRSTILFTAAVCACAYAIDLPWLSPSTIAVIRANAPRVANNFQSDATQRIFATGVVGAFLLSAWAMARWKVARPTRFAVLVSLVTASSALGWFWFHWALFPQPERYQLEMDMFAWLTAAFAIGPRMRRAIDGQTWLRGRRAAIASIVVLAVVCVPVIRKQRRFARWLERPIDIHSTIEYKTAKWLNAHMAGERVFAPGSIGFWLLAFSDSPQITGGFDNGIRNPVLPDVLFQVYAGDQQQYMVDVLQAYGCDAVIGGGKDSAEWYHPIAHPEKLAGLTELWRDGGDAVYDIPRRSRSLAHVMATADLLSEPLSRGGFSALQPYLAALNSPGYPPALFQWRSASTASVTANLQPDQILSVQIAWDKGWNASEGGRRVKTSSDVLGQIVIQPQCSGLCTIELKYDGGTEGVLARAIHYIALASGALRILITVLWTNRRRVRTSE